MDVRDLDGLTILSSLEVSKALDAICILTRAGNGGRQNGRPDRRSNGRPNCHPKYMGRASWGGLGVELGRAGG